VKGVVYILENKTNRKRYIGQTIRELNERWRQHIRNAEQGCRFPLHRAMRKYGVFAFHVVFEIVCKSQKELNRIERMLIKTLKTREKKYGYNLTEGGLGGKPFLGHRHTIVAKNKIRTALKGRKMPAETRAKISASKKGVALTAEHRANLSGSNNGMYGMVGKLNPMFGKKRPDLVKLNAARRKHG
jgi:group I intron endonuclease